MHLSLIKLCNVQSERTFLLIMLHLSGKSVFFLLMMLYFEIHFYQTKIKLNSFQRKIKHFLLINWFSFCCWNSWSEELQVIDPVQQDWDQSHGAQWCGYLVLCRQKLRLHLSPLFQHLLLLIVLFFKLDFHLFQLDTQRHSIQFNIACSKKRTVWMWSFTAQRFKENVRLGGGNRPSLLPVDLWEDKVFTRGDDLGR